jgi:hypothetical protein
VGLDGGKLDLRELRELWDQLLAIDLVVAAIGSRCTSAELASAESGALACSRGSSSGGCGLRDNHASSGSENTQPGMSFAGRCWRRPEWQSGPPADSCDARRARMTQRLLTCSPLCAVYAAAGA